MLTLALAAPTQRPASPSWMLLIWVPVRMSFRLRETDSFNCTVTTTLTINGGPATQVGAPATGNVTASPASGLPIWLLLQAIQQEEPAE